MKALEEATKWMSLFVRLRDAIEWNNKFPEDITGCEPNLLYAACVTCGVIKPWKKMDAGHFIPKGKGGESGVRFDERNVNIQCKSCNAFHQGRALDYENYMREKYGQKVIDELRRNDIALKHQRKQTELMAIALHYKDLYNELLDNL